MEIPTYYCDRCAVKMELPYRTLNDITANRGFVHFCSDCNDDYGKFIVGEQTRQCVHKRRVNLEARK